MEAVTYTGRNRRPGKFLGNAGMLMLLMAALSTHSAGQAPEEFLEYQVKAAFLLNFTKFIDWPPANPGSESPFAICILGKNPFGRALDDIVQGEAINGRPLVVQRMSLLPAPPACRVLFINGSEKDIPQILGTVSRGVLTVGEGEKFVRMGGMISFVVEDRHVRFDISQATAANAGLKLSAKLLSVARSVEK